MAGLLLKQQKKAPAWRLFIIAVLTIIFLAVTAHDDDIRRRRRRHAKAEEVSARTADLPAEPASDNILVRSTVAAGPAMPRSTPLARPL